MPAKRLLTTHRLKAPRHIQDSGRVVLAMRGTGRIHELRVDPLDGYRFELRTSR
jgi:hypothetical protein